MAAVDLFEMFVAHMSEENRRVLAGEIASRRKDLLAARSEDARVRIATEFIEELRGRAAEPRR
jgi:hypothetical protein